ncbi:MAG: hypothetical protein HF973_01770 [Chloroflexi bacterium]|nr:hypothetical protein [Chloroflexota bacterium]
MEHGSVMDANKSAWQRVVDLESGTAMIVTDLHGDWDAYRRYRDRFLELHKYGRADTLILDGDLIHYSGPAVLDKSVEMILDILRLQEELGGRLIYLLGNHEIPHIYSITLSKGEDLFTPQFERAMGEYRPQITALFDSLPFYVRTPGGVTITHAGASSAISQPSAVELLFNFSHQAVLQRARKQITPEARPYLMREMRQQYGFTYNQMAREWFAVTGLDDPRYEDFLVGSLAVSSDPEMEILWPALFTRNEKEYGEYNYTLLVNNLLKVLSLDYHQQKVLITGHIDCPQNGFKLVNRQQLRIASAKHAIPREAGKYLLLDVTKPIETAEELLPHMQSVFV